MKRGFLNTAKAKRVVDDAYASSVDLPSGVARASEKPDASAQAHRSENATVTVVDGLGTETRRDAVESTSVSSSGTQNTHTQDTAHPSPLSNHAPRRPLTLPTRSRRDRPGWGRSALEENLHRVPAESGRGPVKRAIFCQWPRPRHGKPILPGPSEPPSEGTTHRKGKRSPDGFPWGESLYDFFHVARVPSCPYAVSVMTGSELLEAMKELGEMDEAVVRDAIDWAKSEGEPRNDGVASTEKIIEDREHMIRFSGSGDALSKSDDNGEPMPEEGNKDHQLGKPANQGTGMFKFGIPITSSFHPSHYPAPWPLIPFSSPLDTLQEQIPLYLLPQTLHVHDPFNLLPVIPNEGKNTSWASMPDFFLRTYTLELTESSRKQVQEDRAKAQEIEDFKAHTLVILRFQRTREQIETYEPTIEVPLPPYPKRLTEIKESHLYISPEAKVGQGHHSVVYRGEWEVPRALFVRPKICDRCFEECVEKEIKRLKGTGRWERMLRAAGWGPKGYVARRSLPTQEDLDALEDINDEPNLDEDGKTIERELTCIVPAGYSPMEALRAIDDAGFWDHFMLHKERSSAEFSLKKNLDEYDLYAGSGTLPPPILRINPTDPCFSYYDPSGATAKNVCPHHQEGAVPRTAKFTVVAKLSFENDEHLEKEAKNYQQFPDHFFQHWNGYTLINQLHTIVPVRAIVPQFYGYYIPEGKQSSWRPYLSPILLVEHCGTPVDPDTMSKEDKDECASLYLRFQRSGWLHESVYARNLLVQKGSPTELPATREVSGESSFRLIDFGRSRRFLTAKEKREEELLVLRMFEELKTTMGVSIGDGQVSL